MELQGQDMPLQSQRIHPLPLNYYFSHVRRNLTERIWIHRPPTQSGLHHCRRKSGWMRNTHGQILIIRTKSLYIFVILTCFKGLIERLIRWWRKQRIIIISLATAANWFVCLLLCMVRVGNVSQCRQCLSAFRSTFTSPTCCSCRALICTTTTWRWHVAMLWFLLLLVFVRRLRTFCIVWMIERITTINGVQRYNDIYSIDLAIQRSKEKITFVKCSSIGSRNED